MILNSITLYAWQQKDEKKDIISNRDDYITSSAYVIILKTTIYEWMAWSLAGK